MSVSANTAAQMSVSAIINKVEIFTVKNIISLF